MSSLNNSASKSPLRRCPCLNTVTSLLFSLQCKIYPSNNRRLAVLFLLFSLPLLSAATIMEGLVGYRFLPTSEELIHFLKKKRRDSAFSDPNIKEVDIYKYHPSELAGLSSIESDDQVWYFYCTLDQKSARGGRVCRTVKGGYWKIVGRDRVVKDNRNRPIGFKKTLVFYQGRNFRIENRTNWVMHEYHEYHLNKDPISKCKEVVFSIERKQNKKHGLSSAPDGWQPSHNLGYDSRDNVAEDALPELLRDLHLASDSNNQVADNHLMEVESQLLPNQKEDSATELSLQRCNP